MDAGAAGVTGAAIGAIATLLATWLQHTLQNKRPDSLAAKRRAVLRGMLSSDKFTWRSIETLAAAVGADENTTKELLIEIDARCSIANGRSWALVERAPWPEDVQPRN